MNLIFNPHLNFIDGFMLYYDSVHQQGRLFMSTISTGQLHQIFCVKINYMEEPSSQKTSLSKSEVESLFAKIFEDPFNTVCYECGRKTKQWADNSLAIILCLNCVSLYKQAVPVTEIKSINLDVWTESEMKLMKIGGNRKYREFMANYEMQGMIYKQKLRTKATEYYRILLIEESQGREPPMAPDLVSGKQFVKYKASLTQMSPQEIVEEAKEKAAWLGNKTVQIGEKAYTKVHEKVTSGQLKEDMKKAAETVSTAAKNVLDAIVFKFDQITS